MEELVLTGRLPITSKKIEIIPEKEDVNIKSLINQKSADAGLNIPSARCAYEVVKTNNKLHVGLSEITAVTIPVVLLNNANMHYSISLVQERVII